MDNRNLLKAKVKRAKEPDLIKGGGDLYSIIKYLPLLFVVAVVGFLGLPWLILYIGIQLQPNPPRPEITYGEFPFRLEYEINGQRKVIEDTIICEFDGFGSDEGRGKYRKWNQRLASKNERVTLLKVDNTKEVYYPPGSANYYMGDLENGRQYQHSFPNAAVIEKKGGITSDEFLPADKLLNKYHIKLISWEVTQPIKNNFK